MSEGGEKGSDVWGVAETLEGRDFAVENGCVERGFELFDREMSVALVLLSVRYHGRRLSGIDLSYL